MSGIAIARFAVARFVRRVRPCELTLLVDILAVVGSANLSRKTCPFQTCPFQTCPFSTQYLPRHFIDHGKISIEFDDAWMMRDIYLYTFPMIYSEPRAPCRHSSPVDDADMEFAIHSSS